MDYYIKQPMSTAHENKHGVKYFKADKLVLRNGYYMAYFPKECEFHCKSVELNGFTKISENVSMEKCMYNPEGYKIKK